jgi:glycosyltransferase involved in cell wall biosynthesis
LSKKSFDVVIAYSEGVPTLFVSKIKCDNKIAWIHCIYSNYLKLNNYINEVDIYDNYNSIVCVSKTARYDFIKCIPQFEDKTHAIFNCLNNDFIKSSSLCNANLKEFDNNLFSIVSIGRVDPVKRFAQIPVIAKKMVADQINFKWYILGGRADYAEWEKIEMLIKEYDLNRNVFMLGAIDNPYPYIVQSNLLVCTSYSESFNYSVSEAKVLGVPVITTDYECAYEFTLDGINGYIAPIEQIAEKITLLIKDSQEYNRIKLNISRYEYNNNIILDSIYNLLHNKK